MNKNKQHINYKRTLSSSTTIHSQKALKASTLRRDSVHKPLKFNQTKTSNLKAIHHLSVDNNHTIVKSNHIHLIDDKKTISANKIKKSDKITKFNFSNNRTPAQSVSLKLNTMHSKPPEKLTTIIQTPEKSLSIFEKAVENARKNQQTFYQPPDNKPSNFSLKLKLLISATLVILTIAGVLTYQNIPNLKSFSINEVTGFNAKIPSFQSPGFSKISSSERLGYFSSNFHSNTDQRNYKISETSTVYNNNQLLQLYVKPTYGHFNHFKVKSIDVYVSADLKNATWIKNNIWFKIINHNALSLNQVLTIVQTS